MNAITQLVADHEEVERMFKEAETAARAKKRELFFDIKAALETHAWIEETIFYPTLQSEGEKQLIELTAEAIQEHISMKCFLGELAAVSSKAARFEPLLTKLIEDVRHHVKEEEGEMFPAVKKLFSDEALETLGAQMENEKIRYEASMETIYG